MAITSTSAADDPSQRMTALLRGEDDLKLIHTLLAGTRAKREAGGEYLPPHPNEGPSSHQNRINKAVL
ncbi:hypothetical protein JG665_19120, partial [Vibrio cholerae]|uniref:hypothetical protein n=1 Tax=Vibrio cholerae TaxID=666 RepID=UPI0018F0A476